ncbi:unnamed protein product [Brugia pahangi]|uniref:WSC domain-containing protein n=1 Tax=Brugia pahangi TaxID=6280 RepID=A0A158PRL8_BRUPA|nr:unnamed protein product [Brugia pahangi]
MSPNKLTTSCSVRNFYRHRCYWQCDREWSDNCSSSSCSSDNNSDNDNSSISISRTYYHQACDELCKQDSYWYGHCSIWDGYDFTCSCYHYKIPLNGSICKRMQKICNDYCIKRGLEGGYCYVYASRTAPNGTTECKCFEELLQPVR